MSNAPATSVPQWTADDSEQYTQLLFGCLENYENGRDLLAGIKVFISKGMWDIDKMKSLVEGTGILKPVATARQAAVNNFSELSVCPHCKTRALSSSFKPCPTCKVGKALLEHIRRSIGPSYDGSALALENSGPGVPCPS